MAENQDKMSDADMKKREEIVKSMKKSFKDFRKRYGDRAKEVMYATATKMAMKEDAIEEGEVKKANKEKKNKFVASIIQKDLHPSVLPSTAYGRRKLKEETAEERGEYNYEGDMAKSSLRTIIRNAQAMHDMLEEDTNLPEWVQSKLTLAEDYLVSATQYMQSEMQESVEKIDEEEYDSIRDRHAERGTWEAAKRNYQRSSYYASKRRSSNSGSHSVHINGKKWKSFSSHGHASNVAKKIQSKGGNRKITVHKD